MAAKPRLLLSIGTSCCLQGSHVPCQTQKSRQFQQEKEELQWIGESVPLGATSVVFHTPGIDFHTLVKDGL